LGKLKEWRRAVDGDDKPRPFGFAIFEDGESTNRGFRLLEELVIPSIIPGKNGTKLTVLPLPLLFLSSLVTNVLGRYELTKAQQNIFKL